MRYNLLAVIFIIALASCNNGNNDKISTDIVHNANSAVEIGGKGKLPIITFEEKVHDFGEMIQGERVVYGYKFTNTGGSDLVITHVGTTCGCTVGKYPEYPIKPGESGEIEVSFDSHSKRGYQNKKVTILANTEPNTTELRVKAKVILPERN